MEKSINEHVYSSAAKESPEIKLRQQHENVR